MLDTQVTRHEPESSPMQVVVVPERSSGLSTAVSRRGVLKAGFWGSLLALTGGAIATIVNSVYPRHVTGFGGPVSVRAQDVPKPGDPPKQNFEGHFLLVNLDEGEGRIAGDHADAPGGVMALWWKCPHLGCTIPWKPDFISPHDDDKRRGWFNCNCHGSTYTKAGVRIFGPAPHSMDTMQLTVDARGNITVQTAKRQDGDGNNPQRAVPWPPASATDNL